MTTADVTNIFCYHFNLEHCDARVFLFVSFSDPNGSYLLIPKSIE